VIGSPLLIGASANMTAFDLATYSNKELIAVSQLPFARTAQRVRTPRWAVVDDCGRRCDCVKLLFCRIVL
jgi:hypothetical protein